MNTKDIPHPPKLIQFFSTFFFGIAGLTLLFCSLYIPPRGEIHPSVLAAFGMILTFVGTALGIDYNNRSKFYSALAQFLPKEQHKEKGRAVRKSKTVSEASAS